ncbi:hypothetical protein RYR54_001703 [Aeromonas sobria]|nr:hypothetical protein [Aeromonas sobria]
MMNRDLNPYHSPSYSDGALLKLAEMLKNDVEHLYESVLALEKSNAVMTELVTANDKLKAVTRELEKVLDALEGNCYDCSWYKN